MGRLNCGSALGSGTDAEDVEDSDESDFSDSSFHTTSGHSEDLGRRSPEPARSQPGAEASDRSNPLPGDADAEFRERATACGAGVDT